MTKTMFSFFSLFTLFFAAQYCLADDLCSKFPENLKTIDLNKVYINGPFENGMGFVSKDDVPLTGLNHCQAEFVCEHFHARLPTAYELALETTPQKTFIYKSNPEELSSVIENARPIRDYTIDGHENTFYFDSKSYAQPNSMQGRFNVWTRTIHSSDESLAYHFNGRNGYFSFMDRSFKSNQTAIRCVTP